MALTDWLESKWILRWVRSVGKPIFYIIGGAIGIGALIWYISTKNANPLWILACMILYLGPLTWYSAARKTKYSVK
ncbi:MAG TPA: hypothetical protein VEH06_01475 [Candidatus Bathyarchaeia archaeon]|nr:hypothetical protein [Candidatus Bathyarchaeia archaeon]